MKVVTVFDKLAAMFRQALPKGFRAKLRPISDSWLAFWCWNMGSFWAGDA